MYNLIRSFRFFIIIGFILFLLASFFAFLWRYLPHILAFIIIMQIFSLIKFKKIDNKNTSNEKNKNDIIDADYEEVD